MSDFLFNPARLTFHVPDLVSGLLLRGKKGAPRGLVGNGDCILLDGTLGLVGIADGTDRSPQASRRFLATLAREGAARWARGGPPPGASEFLDLATAVLEQFDYNERTTFLCLIPLERRRFLFLAGGDSLLLQVDPRRNTVAVLNKPNMGFTGRSREIVDFGGLEVADDELLVLATDGLWDLQGGSGQETLAFLAEALGAGPLEGAARRLVEERHPAFCPEVGKPYDDMALVLVRPFERGAFPHRILLGGTDDRMERLYERRLKRKALPDTDLPLPDGSPSFWVLPDALEDLRL